MADTTSELHSPAPQGGSTSRHQVADAVVAGLLVLLQFLLLNGIFFFLGLMVMGTDSCAYEACGDPAWLTRALWVDGVGGAVLLAATATLTLIRMVRNRPAWFVPVIGCVLQLALGLACWLMEMQAGPIRR